MSDDTNTQPIDRRSFETARINERVVELETLMKVAREDQRDVKLALIGLTRNVNIGVGVLVALQSLLVLILKLWN